MNISAIKASAIKSGTPNSGTTNEPLIKHRIEDGVVVVQLNRPRARNALSSALLAELLAVLQPLDQREDIGCMLITGGEDFFAAGADIKEMSGKSHHEMLHEDYFRDWEIFSQLRTPKIAVVQGYALGGGCELAMMCDMIYAADNATFGQPEITLGVMPGIGGTQRLTRLVGKAKAMDMILTGESISAVEAEAMGLVSRVFASAVLYEQSLAKAKKIAAFSKEAIMFSREAILAAEDMSLAEGLRYERRLFHSLFATDNQKEGMQAFIEKRQAVFNRKYRDQV